MEREKLFRYLEQRYSSKSEMVSRIPLGIQVDALWQELLNLRRSKSTVLPLYSCSGKPYWYVTTDKMITASEKIVDACFENDTDFDPYTDAPPVLTLEEVFFTSYVEGSQITMQAAMDFLASGQPPRDIEEQLIANNRMAGSYASQNLYRGIDFSLLSELAFILTEGMDNGGQDLRDTDEVDYAPTDGEVFEFPSPRLIPDRINELCAFLAGQKVHPLIKAAVAQAYILLVRPFPEGNERLSRVISSMILLRAGYTFFSDVSLSALIARKGYAYYEAVANILREENGGDLTYFIEYFVELLARAVDERRLRAQQNDEQARLSEREMARTVLTSPVPEITPVEAISDEDETASESNETEANPAAAKEGGEMLEGFFTVPITEPAELENEQGGDDSDAGLKRFYAEIIRLRENTSCLNRYKGYSIILRLVEGGKRDFSTEDLRKDGGMKKKQADNIITYLKERNLVERLDRCDGFVRYRFSTELPEFGNDDYDSEIVNDINTLRLKTRSMTDKRIGETILRCMPKGLVTVSDYDGPADKMAKDMVMPQRMGIVSKVRSGVYRINQKKMTELPRLCDNEKRILTDLYRRFHTKLFTREDAIVVVNLRDSSVARYLHQFFLLHVIDYKEEGTFAYRIIVNPNKHPELFAAPDVQQDDTNYDSAIDTPAASTTEDYFNRELYDDEIYELLDTLAASTTSQRDKRVARSIRKCLGKGVLLQSDYEEWGYTSSMWQADIALAKQLGLVKKKSLKEYVLNRRLRPDLLPIHRKTVTAIYEAFGYSEFSTEMFVATLNYSEAHTYAFLHKLTLLRILDQRQKGTGSQYQLIVNPQDHPECFEAVA